MEAKTIRATYIGLNGSRGFENGKEYLLKVSQNPFTKTTSVKTKDGLSCMYSSAISFLFNWDKIERI